ncbi:MAG: hypothetical protein ACOCV2_12150, partial [Persicimonas sp.]
HREFPGAVDHHRAPAPVRHYPPEGDTCTDAPTLTPEEDSGGDIELPQTHDEELDLAEYNDEFELDPTRSENFCMDVSSAEDTRTGGADAAYRVDLPAQTGVNAHVNFADEAEGSMYFVEDCTNPSGTCQAGAVDSTDNPSQEEVFYTNGSDEEETVYLIVDTAEGESAGRVDLELTYEEVICDPGTRRCADSGDVLEECDEDGTAYSDVYASGCGLGCETDDDCDPNVEDCEKAYCAGDECDTAIEIPADGDWHEFSYDSASFTDNYDIDGAECASDSSPGPEAVYSADVEEGDVIRAWWAGEADSTISISSDCNDYKDTCAFSDNAVDDGAVALEYEAEEDGTHYIFADFDNESGGGEVNFGAQVLESCDPDSGGASCDSDDDVEVCRPPGGLDTLECSGGCTDGRCDDADGDHCFNAKDITDEARSGYSDSIDWTEYTNDMMTPEVCGSGFGDPTGEDVSGQDVYYEIDMDEGDRLVADLGSDDDQANADPALFLTSECLDPGADCIDSAEEFSTSTAEVEYQADEDETVYLIADNNYTTSDLEYDLNVDLQESCDPDTDGVQCDAAGDDLQVCTAEYDTWEPYECDGSCSSDECDTPRGGICEDAIPMDDGDTDERYYDQGWSTLDPSGADDAGSCAFNAGDDSNGPEHIYEVELQDGEELTASYGDGSSSEDGAYSSTIMYLMEDCSAEDTCLDNTEEGSSGSLTYTAEEDETVYVAVDLGQANAQDSWSFELDIDIE